MYFDVYYIIYSYNFQVSTDKYHFTFELHNNFKYLILTLFYNYYIIFIIYSYQECSYILMYKYIIT